MSQQPIIYRVWLPGQSPASADPALTLHNETAIKFFVESIVNGTHPFAGQSIAMAAYQIRNELFERPLAEGTYHIEPPDAPHLQGNLPLQVLYESGMRTEDGSLNIISSTLIDAISSINKEQEQVL